MDTYIEQFHITGDGDLNYDYIIQMLYSAILNKFKVTIPEEEYVDFKEYQDRIFDLVENLRELESRFILNTLEYLKKINISLPDIIIMCWCLPRSDSYISEQIYNKKYKDNINKYNNKLINNIEHEIIKDFCIETLSKTNNVPVHCIDYLWYYMCSISLEFTFYNSRGGNYIGIIISESDDVNINFGFNMEHLLELGLGQIVYINDPNKKGSFRNFLWHFITNSTAVKKLIAPDKKTNFHRQLITISNNPSKYFGSQYQEIPEYIKNIIN